MLVCQDFCPKYSTVGSSCMEVVEGVLSTHSALGLRSLGVPSESETGLRERSLKSKYSYF